MVETSNIANLAAYSASSDQVFLQVGDRVLLVGQTNPAQNGLYFLSNGTTLTRAPEASQNWQFAKNQVVHVLDGAFHAGSFWFCTTPSAGFVLGTTALNFTKRHNRAAETGVLQPGIIDFGNLSLSDNAGGTRVGIGSIWLRQDTSASEPVFVTHHRLTTITILPHAANGTGNPRVDSVVATYNFGAEPILSVIQGTPTAGATIDNRNGAPGGSGGPGVPTGSVVIRDVLIAAGAAANTIAASRDRRPWAKGAYSRRNASGLDQTGLAATVPTVIANTAQRVECSGTPVRVTLRGNWTNAASNHLRIFPFVDGAIHPDFTDVGSGIMQRAIVANSPQALWGCEWEFLPTAGSHLFAWGYAVTSGSVTIQVGANNPLQSVVEEIGHYQSVNQGTS